VTTENTRGFGGLALWLLEFLRFGVLNLGGFYSEWIILYHIEYDHNDWRILWLPENNRKPHYRRQKCGDNAGGDTKRKMHVSLDRETI
jgi:hypothetical protein